MGFEPTLTWSSGMVIVCACEPPYVGEAVVALNVVGVAREAAGVRLLRAVEVALLEQGEAEAGVTFG
jgi:hypothetical protein